ncbi:MAG: TerB family tellurite resistance protein [Pseudomonadota bacterium]
MLARLIRLLGLDEARSPAAGDRRLAVAALLMEAAATDGRIDEDERARILALLMRAFSLGEDAARALVKRAAQRQADAVELHGFTRVLKSELTSQERIALIEMLWEVALADGNLHEYEDQLIRRVAGLLYVDDRARGEARQRVQARLTQEGT